MGKLVESCSTSSATSSYVANGGIEKTQTIGYFKSLYWTADSVEKTPLELKDQATLDALVAIGEGIFLGDGKFEDTSTEATFFEDAELGIKVEQTAKIKSVKFTLATCACTSAELEKMESKTGRLFIQTSTGLMVGRYEGGLGKGFGVSSISVDSTIPVSDTPVEYTTLDITFSDHKGDRKNPLRISIDYLFSDVDQVFAADGVSANTSSNGSVLSTEITIKKDCTDENLTGLVQANFSATDVNGNVLSISSLSESSGVYTIGITTALDKAFISTDGIVDNSGVLYYMDSVTASV